MYKHTKVPDVKGPYETCVKNVQNVRDVLNVPAQDVPAVLNVPDSLDVQNVLQASSHCIKCTECLNVVHINKI